MELSRFIQIVLCKVLWQGTAQELYGGEQGYSCYKDHCTGLQYVLLREILPICVLVAPISL